MQNIAKVSVLRELLLQKRSRIEDIKGVYRWWFKNDAAKDLISELNLTQSDTERIQVRLMEDGQEYWALYFGISTDMLSRAKWHILQPHTISAVKHGTLSTLRQTISALLNIPMSKSEDIVNAYIDANCYWEWEYNDNPEDIERKALSSSVCYPLNIKENKTVSKSIISQLKILRKEYKV
jgi:hypothetical protein